MDELISFAHPASAARAAHGVDHVGGTFEKERGAAALIQGILQLLDGVPLHVREERIEEPLFFVVRSIWIEDPEPQIVGVAQGGQAIFLCEVVERQEIQPIEVWQDIEEPALATERARLFSPAFFDLDVFEEPFVDSFEEGVGYVRTCELGLCHGSFQ